MNYLGFFTGTEHRPEIRWCRSGLMRYWTMSKTKFVTPPRTMKMSNVTCGYAQGLMNSAGREYRSSSSRLMAYGIESTGDFGPVRHEYTFLHGCEKKVKNDKAGKRIAKERNKQLERNEALGHVFGCKKDHGPTFATK